MDQYIDRVGILMGLLLLLAFGDALGSVSLPPSGGTAGSEHDAVFRVSRACAPLQSTTSLSVFAPKGFRIERATAPRGWRVDPVQPGQGAAHWSVALPGAALPDGESLEFHLAGRLTTTPGRIFFRAVQGCGNLTVDWSELPRTEGETPQRPAPSLLVLPVGVAPVALRNGWIRSTLPGQTATAAFMQLSPSVPLKLVRIESPAAALADIHASEIEGNTVRMRALDGPLPLPPRRWTTLRPGGLHLMLLDLRRPLPEGASVPLVLHFVDPDGTQTALQVELPVAARAPGNDPAEPSELRGTRPAATR